MRRNLIILANSRKKGNRCIAGIDPETAEWVRPVYEDGDKGVPWQVRQVDGEEPRLLDIVSIPLARDGPHRDIQPENRRILRGAWKKVSKATVRQVGKYCQKAGLILHNADRRIQVKQLCRVAAEHRKSLSLIRASVAFATEIDFYGKKRVIASFSHGGNLYEAIPVTDYEYERQFSTGDTAEAHCLLTISLGMPWELDNCCYKFVAGVIKL